MRTPSPLTALSAAAVAVASMAGGPIMVAQQNDVEAVRLRPNFYMMAGAGGNIAVQTGPDGNAVVDTGTAAAADRVVAAIQKLGDQPIRYIINTSADPDHAGGNERLARAGRSIFATGPEPVGGEAARGITNDFAASILATETVMTRLSAPKTGAPAPSGAWPTESFAERRKQIYLNHEGIEIFQEPAAHRNGEAIVLFRASDIVVAGDVIDTTRFPLIDVANGGTVQGEIDALNHIISLTVRPIPFVFEEGGTYVIPGHGRVYKQIDVVNYRDMVVTIRDIIADMAGRGLTLDQVKAADPAKPYRQFGATSGPWTTNDFVEAVYKTLPRNK